MKKECIHIIVDSDLKTELVKEAKSKGLTLNGYIRMLIIERKK